MYGAFEVQSVYGSTECVSADGGGTARGWSPRLGQTVYSWSVVSESAGLVTYVFRSFQDAVLARQVAEACDGIGPAKASELLGRLGAVELSRAARTSDKGAFKGMQIGEAKLKVLKGFFDTVTLEGATEAAPPSVIVAAVVAMGFPRPLAERAQQEASTQQANPSLADVLRVLRGMA